MPRSLGLSFVATTVSIIFGVLRLFGTSNIQWIRSAVAPYALLEVPFFFTAIFLWFYIWFSRPKVALIVALIATVGFWYVAGF